MKHSRLIVALAVNTAFGFVGSAAFAADGDGLPSFAQPAFGATQAPATASQVPAIKQTSALPVKAPTQQTAVRERSTETISGRELNVPGHPEFGRIASQ